MPPDSQRWPQVETLGQMFANHQPSWKLTPAQFAMATLDSFHLLKFDTFVVGSAKMRKTWCRLEIFTRLQSPSLNLCKSDVSDWRKTPTSFKKSGSTVKFLPARRERSCFLKRGRNTWLVRRSNQEQSDLQITDWVRFAELPNRRWRIESNVKEPKLNGRNREGSRQPWKILLLDLMGWLSAVVNFYIAFTNHIHSSSHSHILLGYDCTMDLHHILHLKHVCRLMK